MKLQTSIPPRRDGTVRHTGKDRRTYVFEAGPDGELTCDVDNEDEAAALLATGMFWPADPDDFEKALTISTPAPDSAPAAADADEDLDDEDEVIGNGLPVEANTPPVTRKKPGPKPKAK